MERPREHNILPGMSGRVALSIPQGTSGAIPKRAIIHDAGKTFVWQVNPQGMAHKKEILLDEHQHILSGLNDGDLIAISGVGELREGQRVRPWVKERGL